jgi:addiction module RelE/StbE family toxin
MLPIRPTSRFKKDLKRAAKQRRNIKKLHHVLEQLAIPAPLLPKYKDHKKAITIRGIEEYTSEKLKQAANKKNIIWRKYNEEND